MEPLSEDHLQVLAGRFGLLASATRLRILSLLCERERSVAELLALTGQKPANLSKQLGLLHAAGFLRRRLEGVHAYFSVTTRALERVCRVMAEILEVTGFTRERPGAALAV